MLPAFPDHDGGDRWFVWRRTIGEHATLKAGVAKCYKNPTNTGDIAEPYERNDNDGATNPTLQPPRISQNHMKEMSMMEGDVPPPRTLNAHVMLVLQQ